MMKNLYWIFLAILLVLSLTMWEKGKRADERWKTAVSNVKAYESMLDDARNQNDAFQLTIDQLKNSKDSIFQELNRTRKELKVKDKNVESLQYVYTTLSRTDTIVFKGDTIFKEPEFSVDTVIGDKWYQLKLGLDYPSSIVASPQFTSEKHVIVSTKKETVNPPKKLWLLRLFQKKHNVLKVDVVEKNPYVKDGDFRYIEIIR